MKNKGCLIVLSAPSGCGKNTVYEALTKLDPTLSQTVSATTRAPRTGEADGVDYYFLSQAQFRDKIEDGAFVEYVQYGGNYYGTLKSEVARLLSQEKTVVLIIEVNGARNVKRAFPRAVTVFILPPDMETLRRRLVSRGENTPEEIERRIAIAEMEMKSRDLFDHQVINDDLDRCVREVYDIIQTAKNSNTDKGDDIL